MMVPDIITKLQNELNQGISTEIQVVYLMAGIRKIIEQGEKDEYENLKFHADWALHSRLKGTFAQKILVIFAEAREHFIAGTEFSDLPSDLHSKVREISGMNKFKEELSNFLRFHNLPDFISGNLDKWTYFLHLYAKVIQDCPLLIRGDNSYLDIARVLVRLELANEIIEDQIFYKIIWNIEDKEGRSGEFFVINSFTQ